ncbi:MAG: hypothetical protein HWN67_00765 [Candidatus Helarchaeota archaeon]|nr:hypothetical protein [Candidatus Helarchaeota archaeon]
MSFRIVLDESHNNNLDFLNSEGFQVVLNRLGGVIFRLIQAPITFEKISGEDLVILGCPTTIYSYSEINALERFVERGKGLVLISGNGGDLFYNTNLSEIGRRFEFEFNNDQVEDEMDNMGLSAVVKISKFKTIHFSENVKSIIYSGCSINILDNSCKIIAKSNPKSNPPNTPVVVLSSNNRVMGLGGFNIFIDHPEFGIDRTENLLFVSTIFDYLKNQIEYEKEKTAGFLLEKPITNGQDVEVKDESELEAMDESAILDQLQMKDLEGFEETLEIELDKISPKNANKKFEEFSQFYIKKLDKISEKIDEFWLFIKKSLSKPKKNKMRKVLHKVLHSKYQNFLEKIGYLASEIDGLYSIFSGSFSKNDFDSDNALINWFENEASCREKLDMIRNNLMAILDSVE